MAQIIDLGKIRFNWAGTYDSGTSYSYNDLVKYGPNLYAFTALTSATGVVPTTTSTWAVVTQGIQYRGTYTSGTHYYVNDVVIDGQNTYITVTEHTASSNVALANANLNLIAQGQQGLPNQSGKQNQLLASDGTQSFWTARPLLSKLDVGDSQGATAVSFETNAGLTNVISTFSATATDFAQFVVVNNGNGASVSTDVIVYPQDGTNSAGFIDMGITSNQFSALQYGITGPHDGYIFMSAPMPGIQSVISYSVSNGLATINTSAPHGWSVGNVLVIQQVLPGINGKRVVQTVPNNSSITVSVTGVANATTTVLSSPGTVHKPIGNGNLVFATDATGLTNNIVFAAGGYDSGRTQMTIYPDQQVNINISTQATSATTGALVVAGGIGVTGSSWTNGDIHVGGIVYSGDNTATSWGLTQLLTAPAAVFEVTSADNTYGQFALHNKNTSSSVDFIAYPDNGNDSHGWIDMGMTGSTFNSATYGITGPNDGYLFVDAPTGSTGAGNLVLATGNNGTANRIVFAAGGFVSGRTQMQIIPDQSVVINIATQSTSATTGALIVNGGVGITGNVNIAGNITFGGSGTQVSTANLAVNAPLVFTGTGSVVSTNDLGIVTEGKYQPGAYNSISNPYGIPGVATLNAASGVTAPNYIVNKQLTSNVATLVTYYPHPFVVGDSVTIASVDSVFNGTYTITVVPSTTSFSYAKTNPDVASQRIGDQTFSINQKSIVSNVATLQTTANHNYVIGQTVVVSGVDATFNGTYVITATTANSFSYAKTSINVSATPVSPVGTAVVNTSQSTVVISSATRTRWSAWYKQAASVSSGEQGTWNLVSNISTLPTTTINLAQATYGALDVQYDLIKVGGVTIQGGLNSGSFTLVGNIQAPAWTTNGIRHVGNSFTATDATSTGTVGEAYTNAFGQTTVAALNTGVTYTNYATVSLAAPVAGTNVTITNAYSLISQGNTLTRGSATFNGATYFTNAVNSFTGATQFTGLMDVQALRENFLATNSYSFDCSQAGVFWSYSAGGGNYTYNFVNVPNPGAGVNKIMAVDVFQQQGGTPYIPTTVNVNGASVNIRWAGGLTPTLTVANGIDVFGFTFLFLNGAVTCLATASSGY